MQTAPDRLSLLLAIAAAILAFASASVRAAETEWSGGMQPIYEADEMPGATLPPASPGTAAYQFSRVPGPAPAQDQRVFGTYNRGCLAGAVQLSSQSPDWQIMRPSRNRAWGHPDLIAMAGDVASTARKAGWPGLLIGDLAQPRGGPMPYGHASHQIGLDIDIWMTPMPRDRLSKDGLEQFKPPSMIDMNTDGVNPTLFGPLQIALIKAAAEHPKTARVFVNARIKNALCKGFAPENRGWLNRVRPAPGHDAHLHIRMHCPANEPHCKGQKDPLSGDGCDELAAWIRPPPPPPKTPAAPQPPRGNQLRLSALPAQCRQVLAAP